MKNRLFCNLWQRRISPSKLRLLLSLSIVVCGLLWTPPAQAGGEAPGWMRALVNVPLPAYDEKTNAVLLYSDESVNVLSADKIKRTKRVAYKILRPEGRDYGTVRVFFNPQERITELHGWCIPKQGKDYVVRDKDAMELSLPIDNGELVSDVKVKLLRIPASDPGNIIGYEVETE